MRYSRSYSGVEVHEIRYPKPYGFFAFVCDIVMLVATGGLWLVWIFVREMRRR
jgi:hypothetical protein